LVNKDNISTPRIYHSRLTAYLTRRVSKGHNWKVSFGLKYNKNLQISRIRVKTPVQIHQGKGLRCAYSANWVIPRDWKERYTCRSSFYSRHL